MTDHTTSYIALGSNLNRPLLQLRRAVKAIAELPNCKLLACSPIYLSTAIGPGAQPDYLNAVVKIHCTLSALALLNRLQGIELAQQRKRRVRWGPRTLDLDILLHGKEQWHSDRLSIPHPRMLDRDFVFRPLFDLSNNLVLPSGELLADFVKPLNTEHLRQTRLQLVG